MRKGKMVFAVLWAGLLLGSTVVSGRDLDQLQKDFRSRKFGMFIHFNMATFADVGGWSTGREDPAIFRPEKLDMGQWADAAAAAKMEYAILTVKHTGGWCLWDSDLTDHDVTAFKNYKNGKGDLVREFVDAFRSRGLKVGLYYCFPLWDAGWTNYWTLPIEGYAAGTNDALAFVEGQFRELLTRYGKIDLIWIDQNLCTHGGLKDGDWRRFKAFVHGLQPDCLVIGNNMHDFADTDVIGYEYPYALELPPSNNVDVAEVCDKLNAGWFAVAGRPAPPVRSADYVVNRMLRPLDARNSNYLLNCSPESTGLLNEKTVALLKEIGRRWNPDEPTKRGDSWSGILCAPVSKVATDRKEVALIFPASWSVDEMLSAAKTLSEDGGSGTFFVRRDAVKAEPKKLKEIADLGCGIGNGSKGATPVAALETGLEIGAEVRAVGNLLGSCFPCVVFRSSDDRYGDLVWPVLNYFNLIAVKPAETIEPGAVMEVASPDRLESVLSELDEAGLKPVSVARLISGSKEEELKSLAADASAEVVSGAR